MRIRPVVGLVLGAGGARGLAHIGVLQRLKEYQIPIDLIVGSSIGALIGSAYGASTDLSMLGRLAEYFNYSVMWDLRVPHMGFLSGERIWEFVRLITKNKSLEELDPKVVVIATNIEDGEPVRLDRGRACDAVRASISVPGVFEPVKYNGMLLVDGGVAARLPSDIARHLGAEIVLAVDVTFCDGKQVIINNILDVIVESIEIMEKQIFENMSREQADILIQPQVGHVRSREFHRAAECIKLGRNAVEDKIQEIRRMLRSD